jgi:hypothetical protein
MNLKQLPLGRALLLAVSVPFVPAPGSAETLVLHPVADTSLISAAPDNNNGGQAWVLAGVTQNFTTNRGLFRFDLSGLPPGSVIESASLSLEVTRQPRDGYAPGPFGLHRMLQAWGEGNKIALDNAGGLGAPATAGEATWNAAFAGALAWTAPGGAADADFAAIASAEVFIYGVGDSPYLFPSTPELIADVQAWLDHPASNFGWMLRCEDESPNFTARRFGSREDAGSLPQLFLQFTVIPEPSALLLLAAGLLAVGCGALRSRSRHGRHRTVFGSEPARSTTR